MDFASSQTRTNLARSFAGECQAGARYQFLAEQCRLNNLDYLSKILKTIATNEMAHARIFRDLLVNLENEENFNVQIEAGYPFYRAEIADDLKISSKNEYSESNNIYPSFARIAKDEGFPEVEKAFLDIAEIENCHYMLTNELGEKCSKNKLTKSDEPIKWKCMNCGHEETGKSAWKNCPVCGHNYGYVKIQLSDQ
ncbi:MAG: ferritin family protein [Clostridia bacterium]